MAKKYRVVIPDEVFAFLEEKKGVKEKKGVRNRLSTLQINGS